MPTPRDKQPVAQEQPLVRFGLSLAHWSEKWFPDPLIFALLGIVIVFLVGLLLHQSPAKLAVAGGKNFWTLVPIHHADGDDHHWRIRRRFYSTRLSRHPRLGRNSQVSSIRRRHGRAVLHVDLAYLLGIKPH